MADYINNVAAADAYSDACTLGPNYDASYCVITIANNPALMQFAVGVPGNWRWTDEREFQSIPQSFRVGNVIGLRVRNATPGVVARVLAVLAGPDDPDFQSGQPFSGVLTSSGGVTPGGASVEVDHNGAAISTEPKLDFEDSGGAVWTITDDPANTRAKIALPNLLKIAGAAARELDLGSGEVAWAGGTPQATAANFAHNLGVVPALVLVTADLVSAPFCALQATPLSDTDIRVGGRTSDGSSPVAGTTALFYWLAIA